MPNISNPSLGREFEQISLTKWINQIDVQYDLISRMGLFKPERINTTVAAVEKRDTQTQLVLARPRDTKDQFLKQGIETNRDLVYFEVPHIPVDDVIQVSDLQNVRALGTDRLTTVRELIQRRLTEAKTNIQQTIEYFQLGALQGRLLNTDGSLLGPNYDFFNAFNVTQTEIQFKLGTASTETRKKCTQATRAIDKAAGGDRVTMYTAFASDTFFDAFVNHPNTKNAYANYQAATERLGGDVRTGFKFGGINWISYNPVVKGPSGTNVDFLPEGEAIIFPEGTRNIFQNVIAPAHTMDTVNTIGLDFYARSWSSLDGQKVHLRSEANQFPVCANPAVLIKAIL